MFVSRSVSVVVTRSHAPSGSSPVGVSRRNKFDTRPRYKVLLGCVDRACVSRQMCVSEWYRRPDDRNERWGDPFQVFNRRKIGRVQRQEPWKSSFSVSLFVLARLVLWSQSRVSRCARQVWLLKVEGSGPDRPPRPLGRHFSSWFLPGTNLLCYIVNYTPERSEGEGSLGYPLQGHWRGGVTRQKNR